MKTPALLLALVALALPVTSARAQRERPSATLAAFRSDRELSSYFLRLSEIQERRRLETERREREGSGCRDSVRVTRGRTATPAEAMGAPQPAVIRGLVTAAKGRPVSGVSLAILSLRLSTSTGRDGRFRLSLPAERLTLPRRVTLISQMGGYQPLQRTLSVSPGDSIDIVFPLCGSVQRSGRGVPVPSAAPAPAAAAAAEFGTESVTNTQSQGVDEGGIVKLHGDHLVILRRGRLFTVAVGAENMRPIATVDAFGPGIDARGAWYDEMLVAGDKVVVIGYSYERGGTELGVFHIDDDGGLRHLATYQLRSNDYYSSRNYASRLIGTTLVFYTPLYLPQDLDDPGAALPSMRRWDPRANGGRFEPIATPQRVYRPARDSTFDDPAYLALHTVTTCDLAAPDLRCEATVVIGPAGRVFYVSPGSVYVWMTDWRRRGRPADASMLVRMPLDGGGPSALGVSGSPVDQFSFLESADGWLNVLVRSGARGDAMWNPESAPGDAALLRLPPASFGDGSGSAPASRYRPLPAPGGRAFQNRFVGDHLLYGTGSGWDVPQRDSATLYIVPWAGGEVERLTLPHGVDRIEAMGSQAVVVGTSGRDLTFSGIRLEGRPVVAQRYTMTGASQGETRSHGFFYKADGPQSGVLGLPVRGPGRPGYEHLFRESASILFLRNTGARFDALGTLKARAEGATDDGCRASCVDWYGNARPLFFRGRTFALLGYELVEGGLRAGRIQELRRVSFAPRVARD